ncbi:MAG: beta-ketoacyl-[acyl-carrier-protein] synthase family protein [Alphaproteobacteria bacterium]
MQRIVITGLGVVSAIGNNVETFRANLFAGKSGIDSLTFPVRGQEVRFPAAPVKNFAVEDYIDAKKVPMVDRFSQFAVAAATQAFRDSGLTLTDEDAERMAVITGTGAGGQNTVEESYYKLLDPAGSGRVHPFTIPRLMANAGSSQISMALGIKGPGFTVASACASAIHAMGVTLSMLRSGLIDAAITGGAEACLTYGTLKGWEALRVMAPDVCRPFSAGRLGMVLGEGAGMLVLETEEKAKKRGAKIYAEFAGFGMSSDAKDITTPDVTGASRAVINCLRDAGLAPGDVDYINAHGTGTRINDATETAAIKLALGDHAKKIALSSSKSLFGHALGAAGALEMLATVLAVREDTAPPTINYQGADPECDLDYVPNTARAMPIRAALNNSFAFGGLNASVAVRKVS